MTGCHVMAKPASSRCNLHCRYCFYLDKPQQTDMSDATLEAFIRQQIEAQPGDDVQFAWQGGEPTLCGVDFFRRVVALQQRYAGEKRIYNAFQTNGILLNDEWCRFFKAHGWLVGISIDGPAEMHDAMRVSRSENPTHQRVLRAIETLKAHNVEFNLLVVVGRHNCAKPQMLYRYLRELGTPFIQFIPLLEMNDDRTPDEHSVPSDAWGAFLRGVFDVWVRKDIGRIFVQLFDSTLGIWNGFSSQMCAMSETCGHAFALESNGDVYQCDHYVYPSYRLGNIHHQTLSDINASDAARDFGLDKKRTISNECRTCHALRLCNGDCPKHRDASGKSALCEGYLDFFSYTAAYMKVMRDLIRHQRSPMEIMTMLK
ncbi:anaerobic sulfatase maturase [Scandinavium manionii]|uniref:anaerobic sulfatase maturase n=1 Tax=Scandinavium manionii TaxID=2926520 RepID=UPI0021667329|nr:anaerobic sulfatase maturase [Scandinavium manionii]MCS2148695.1 anaerobic sulfatase maturase [Scandinavium manionii]